MNCITPTGRAAPLLQDWRVEALGEPAVDRREEITGFGALALIAPESGLVSTTSCEEKMRFERCDEATMSFHLSDPDQITEYRVDIAHRFRQSLPGGGAAVKSGARLR
jgi:hypothetical protein